MEEQKDKHQIVKELAEAHKVEELIENIAKEKDDALKDLAQDIYVDLLMKPEEKIVQMYEDGELNFFIIRMIINNLNSKNSPYYYRYKKFGKDTDPLDGLNI